MIKDEPDIIARPAHYIDGRKYEPRKVIRDWDLNFNLGNAVKYISRAGRKGSALEDLRKAGLVETKQRYRKSGGKSSLLFTLKE